MQFDPILCRGCGLCAAVCPTGALIPAAYPSGWWGGHDPLPTHVTLTCDTGDALSEVSSDGETMTCRCVGQAHPGALLDLFRRGVEHVSVLTCAHCRFEAGPRLASQHVAETVALLQALGQIDSTVTFTTPVREGV